MSDDIPLREHFQELRRADKEALEKALANAEQSVLKAEKQAQEWRENANEWRQAMNAREKRFLTRKEFYTMMTTFVLVLGAVLAVIRF